MEVFDYHCIVLKSRLNPYRCDLVLHCWKNLIQLQQDEPSLVCPQMYKSTPMIVVEYHNIGLVLDVAWDSTQDINAPEQQ